MTEQYRIIADRDKGDDPTFNDITAGDRYTMQAQRGAAFNDTIVRIERPVPTTECGSQGPRIGGEGRPVCEQVQGHDGLHRGGDDTGFENVTWSDPRPVPTTDEPSLTERLAELRQPVNGHRPYCLSNQPGDGPCNCDLGSPHPPTREQIAEAETRVRDWLAAHDSLDTDTERERPIVVTNGARLNASDILALVQNGADR